MSYCNNEVDLNELVGLKIKDIEGLESGSGKVCVLTEEGNEYLFYHWQDCCENVYLNDYEISSNSLSNGTVLSAEVVTNSHDNKPSEYSNSWTWTFYKIETDKGGLWMRWLGESNGYYSESVYFVWVNKPSVN